MLSVHDRCLRQSPQSFSSVANNVTYRTTSLWVRPKLCIVHNSSSSTLRSTSACVCCLRLHSRTHPPPHRPPSSLSPSSPDCLSLRLLSYCSPHNIAALRRPGRAGDCRRPKWRMWRRRRRRQRRGSQERDPFLR